MLSKNFRKALATVIVIFSFFLLEGMATVARATTTPYSNDANIVLLDHFDGATSASILAYSETGAACGSAKPSATPNSAYVTGSSGLSQALSLNPPAGQPTGSGTYLQYPGGQLLSQPNGTIEFWTYLSSYGTGGVSLVDQGQFYGACMGWTFSMSVNATGQLQAGAWAAFGMNSGATTVPLNTWTHVAASWGSTGAKLYINGVQVGSDVNTGMPANGYAGSVLVNSGAVGHQIDELRISNVQRTSFSASGGAGTGTHNASGTYAWNSATGVLTINTTSSNFICDGLSVGTENITGVAIATTTMTWSKNGVVDMTWTRSPAGTANDIIGVWTESDSDGSSWVLTVNSDGTFSLAAVIVSCGGGGGAGTGTHNASGTYTWNSGTGTFTLNTITSDFTCDGPNLGTDTQTGVTITATTMTWSKDNMTWTRSSGTAGDIVGTWTSTDGTTGNLFTLTFNANGTVSVTGIIVQCSGGGGGQNPSASSQHWSNGYSVQFQYNDPNKTATAVSVTGTGITGTEVLTYNAGNGSWNSWTSPSTQVSFGTTYPAGLPYTYTFSITDATGTRTATSTVSCFQVPFATNLSPTGSVTGTPTFSWVGIADSSAAYSVELHDSNGNNIWNNYSISGTSIVYNGPPLASGVTYNYNVNVGSSSACSNGTSFAQGSFTYGSSGGGATISFTGDVKAAANYPGTPVSGAQVQVLGISAPPAPVTTDSVGHFALTGIPVATNFSLMVSNAAGGFVPVYSKTFNWNQNIQMLLPFALFTQAEYGNFGITTGNGMILGQVTQLSSPNSVLAGATVTAVDWTGGTPGTLYPVTYANPTDTATGVDGSYYVKNVPDGRLVKLTVSLPFGSFSSPESYVPVHAGGVSEESFFGLSGPTVSLSGVVTGYANGQPLSGALIQVLENTSLSTNSGADGSFTLTGLPAGVPFTIQISASGFVSSYPGQFQTTAGISGRVFPLFTPNDLATLGVTTGGLIFGRVADIADMGADNIAGAVVSYTSSRGSTYAVKYQTDSGALVTGPGTFANGKFYIVDVQEGDSVTVSAVKADYTFPPVPKTFATHAGGVSLGSIPATPPLGAVTLGDYIMDKGSATLPPAGIGGVQVDQINEATGATIHSTTSLGPDGVYTLPVAPGVPFYLKFSKTGFYPTYTAVKSIARYTFNKSSNGNNLFTSAGTDQFDSTHWNVTPGEGIIRAGVKDQAGNPLGGATVSYTSGQNNNYTVCYDEKCTSTLTATDLSTGRYVIKNVVPGDTVTVTAQKSGLAFNSRVFHIYANSADYQGGITAMSLDEAAIRNGIQMLINAYNAKNITQVMIFFSSSYLQGGETLAMVQNKLTQELQNPNLPVLSASINSVIINGNMATVQITWIGMQGNGAETLYLRNENGTWLNYGDQVKYKVEAWSGTRYMPSPSGNSYWAGMNVRDAGLVIQSVNVTGPGLPAGGVSLVWNAADVSWNTWNGSTTDVGPQFGNTKPGLPLTYIFTITEKANPSVPVIVTATINNFVEVFATPLTPQANATVSGGNLAFTWGGVGSGYTYAVELNGPNGHWGSYDLMTTSFTYDGPTLAAGSYSYNIQVRDADGNFSMVTVPFTYSSAQNTITIKSDASTLAAAVGAAGSPSTDTQTRLDTADTTGLAFVPVSVGGFGTYTPIPPNAPSGTVVVNIPPGDGENGYFKATFTLPSDFTNITLTGAANVDDFGRAFLNGYPLTSSIISMDQNTVSESGNVTFTTSNAAYFKAGVNEILISDTNTRGGPSGGAFYANVQYDVTGTVPGQSIPGDINNDQRVDLADAILSLQFTAGTATPLATINKNADVNGDKLINTVEAIYILQRLAGLRSAPTAPTGVTATPGNGAATIAWTAAAGATSYNIYWSPTTGVTPANGTKITGVINPYIQTGLTNGTTYYYVVTAVNGNGESTASIQVSVTPSTAPSIQATVLSLAGGANPLGWLQQVQVYTDSTQMTPITNATVTVNGSPLTYDSMHQQYRGAVAIAAGATVTLNVTIGSTTYTATGTQYTTFPSVTAPTSGATWQAASANTITWAAGAPTAGATYVVGLIGSNGKIAYPAGDNGPINVPTSSASYIIPVNGITAGSYQVLAGIGTTGSGNNTAGISIANTAAGSGLWIGGFTAFIPITVQ